MSESSSGVSSLVVLPGFPVRVELSQSFVNLEVVEGNVSNDFLLDGRRVSVRSNSIFLSESFEFCISIKAVLD